MTRDTHLARLPQTPSHPEPSEGGQPQREVAKSGGRGRAAEGQGQRNISPPSTETPGLQGLALHALV